MDHQVTRLSNLSPFTICISKTKAPKKYILLYKDEEHIIYYMEDKRCNLVQQSKNGDYPQNAAVIVLELPDGDYKTLCHVRYRKEEHEKFREKAIGYLLRHNLRNKKDKPKVTQIAASISENYKKLFDKDDLIKQKSAGDRIQEISIDTENDIQELNAKIGYLKPELKQVVINKIERGVIAQKIKKLYEYKCRICEKLSQNPCAFIKKDGTPYIETHHIIAASELQPGSLASSNLITLCANHHRQMHYGNVLILKNTPNLLHITLDGREVKFAKHNPDN